MALTAVTCAKTRVGHEAKINTAHTMLVIIGLALAVQHIIWTEDDWAPCMASTNLRVTGQQGQQLCGLHILSDNCRTGRMTRNSAEHFPSAVYPVTASFRDKNDCFKLKRYQNPVVLAWAVTTHKGQGMISDELVCLLMVKPMLPSAESCL